MLVKNRTLASVRARCDDYGGVVRCLCCLTKGKCVLETARVELSKRFVVLDLAAKLTATYGDWVDLERFAPFRLLDFIVKQQSFLLWLYS